MEILKLDEIYPIGRYRDIYLNEDGTQIILYTRNGGGNRDHYNDTDEGEDCECTGCIMTYQIPEHPQYIKDYDDDCDCTYAYVVYSIPEQYQEECCKMATGKAPATIGEKFAANMEMLMNLGK